MYKIFNIFFNVLFYLLFFFIGHIKAITLLNSSYDVSREMFSVINSSFIEYWLSIHPEDVVTIRQSHSGSTRQALSVLQGLKADVVTYNQVTDIYLLCDYGNLISKDWQNRLPNNSSPYYSTMAFLVRSGNPKCVFDWCDLLRDDVKLVFPNPKTSGNGRYVYLAAFSVFSDLENGDYNNTFKRMVKFLKNVEVFDIGGRGASTTFVDRGIGDVLISFESEINSIKMKYSIDNFEVIVPKLNILVEFPVTWVDKNVYKNGTEDIAKAYLSYLYSINAQIIINNFYYRVYKEDIMLNSKHIFPVVELFSVNDKLGDWREVMKVHFSEGGELDKLLRVGH